MVVDQVSDTEVDRVFHALADATRRDIVRRVIDAEQSISEHVTVLQDAGLVVKQRRGREQRVTGQRDALGRAQALLDEYERLWRDRFARMGDVLRQGDDRWA